MQKKIIVLAVAGAIAGLAAGAASADNATVYGRMDYGYVNTTGNSGSVTSAQSKSEFVSGAQSGSRIGVKGAEDIGGGAKVIFEAEFGLGIDGNNSNKKSDGSQAATPNISGSASVASGQTTFWNRHSYVGLTGGFGTVVGGRLDGVRYGVFTKYDAFGAGTVGNFTSMTTQVNRADNAIAYISPTFAGGFSVLGAYSSNINGPESAGNINDAKLATIMGSYVNGPISIDLDWEQVKDNKATAAGTASSGSNAVAGSNTAPYFSFDTVTVTTIAGSYDFGVAKVSALWDNDKTKAFGGATIGDVDTYYISGKIPFGAVTGKVTYGKTKEKANGADLGAKKFAVGVDYSLSKRTTIYADYARISNDTGVSKAISVSAWANGTGGVNGIDLGIAHNF